MLAKQMLYRLRHVPNLFFFFCFSYFIFQIVSHFFRGLNLDLSPPISDCLVAGILRREPSSLAWLSYNFFCFSIQPLLTSFVLNRYFIGYHFNSLVSFISSQHW
jgi:hypothetical protein